MIQYYLLVPFLYFFSWLPTSVLYYVSDAIAFVLRNIVKYRRDVVLTNLRNSFPEKSEEEIQRIAKRSYTHLADRIIENVKCINIGDAELKRRCKLDPDSKKLLNELYDNGKDLVILLGHTGAWEWATFMANRDTPYKTFGIYSPAKNKYFNRLIVETRGRMGMTLISMKETSEYFKQKHDERTLHAFFTDQSPSNPANAYWTTFLNQDSAFFYGGARYAVKHQCVPVFVHVREDRRGYFTILLKVIKEDVSNTNPDEIVQGFVDLLEQQLRAYPTDWLWSHKRWKRKRPAPEEIKNPHRV